MQPRDSERAQWSSEPAFVFSMSAAAVGLGNLWRFPYMVGENGGAAFILAYLIALVIVALPVMMLEVGAGRLAQGGVVATFRQVHRAAALFGWLVVGLTFAITSYYLVITGWTLGYAVASVADDLEPFESFSDGWASLWWFLVVLVLAALLLIRGIAMIERLSKVLMPVLLVVIVGLAAFGATLPGWSEARDFMLAADFSRLGSTQLWLFAFGQAFYSVAIGQGYLITYGSHIPKGVHVPRASLTVAGVETMVALLAGWMLFPIVFTYGFAPDAGSQLAFSTLPRIFDDMPGGYAVAVVFFVLFFFAAFSSCVAGMKVIVTAVAEELGLTHRRAVALVAAGLLVLGLPSALSFSPLSVTLLGQPFLEAIDQIGGTNVMIASGVIGAGLFAWAVPRARIYDALGIEARYWLWRVVLVGRALPVFVVGVLAWTLVT